MTVREQLRVGWRWLGWEAAAVGRTVRYAIRGTGPERDTMVQALKMAGAAIAAWALAGWWLKAPLALMAPWTALALVDATVYRSLRSGLQQISVIVVGAVWASLAMALAGGSTLGAMIIALPVLALVGTYRRFGAQGIYGSTTALFVITYGAYSLTEVGHRLLETCIGAVIGISVNAFVFPPIHLRSVYDQLQRLPRDSADLLRHMADGLREEWGSAEAEEWRDRARRLQPILRSLADARQWTNESLRLNPAWNLRRRSPQPPPESEDTRWHDITEHLTVISRTLARTTGEDSDLARPAPAFLDRYAVLAERTAEVCAAEAGLFDQDEDEKSARERRKQAAQDAWRYYDSLADAFGQETGPAAAVSGELLVETRQLLSVLAPHHGREPQ
ncbi:FUSC family protein [Streptomyces ochraceiscleroticus]|uniref:Aromatic acid exporter family protein n=1 Tax=Streptomyces ochraceiscleroticus TaxID=47761 RepID=A0ABW1MKG7_9ACTN|nr:aromatic acid exporter family protein [Streptomyces ochraceiscleroticus]